MKKNILKEIDNLQDNLQTIRKVAGWTAEELGDRIGVTKQTISNLENKNTQMTKTQYIALRAIIDYEIMHNPNSDALARVVDVLLNDVSYESTDTDKNEKIEIPTFLQKTDKSRKKVMSMKVGDLVELVEKEPSAKVAVSDWLARIIGVDND